MEEHRVEIDTSLPFKSVRAAVHLFDDKKDVKKFKLPEKHAIKETELQVLKKELANVEERLRKAENAKEKAFADMNDPKKLLEIIMDKGVMLFPHEGDVSHANGSTNVTKQNNPPNDEIKHVVWEVQLKVAREQHMTVVSQLESVKEELQNVRRELGDSIIERENALRQAEEAFISAEINAKRVEGLHREMSGTKESLRLVKMACIEANKERAAALIAAQSGGNESHHHHHQNSHNVALQELTDKVFVTNEEVIRLKQELAMVKEQEDILANKSSQALSDLENTKSELKKALASGASLHAKVESMTKEMVTIKESEMSAKRCILALKAELSRTKAELSLALLAEARANEAFSRLSLALQNIRAEAEEAKKSAKGEKEEAERARDDAEKAEAMAAYVGLELEFALKAAEEAKEAQKMSTKGYEDRPQKVSITTASSINDDTQGEEGITISQEEYERLKKETQNAEKIASLRVAAVTAQIEAMEIGELELRQKLITLNDEITVMKKNMNEAIQRAKMAEAAKLAVEGEMRKWREKQALARKEVNHEKEEQVENRRDFQANKLVDRSETLSLSLRKSGESLAHMLSMKMPPSLDDDDDDDDYDDETSTLSEIASVHSRKKKKKILPSFNLFVGRKTQHSPVGRLIET